MAELLIRSDARAIPLADESVQCCVTSPPYWGLRSYRGGENMIGLEPTFEDHLANLVAVFREVWRVAERSGSITGTCTGLGVFGWKRKDRMGTMAGVYSTHA